MANKNPVSDSLFKTYGVPASYWRKDVGLTVCGAIGKSLLEYIDNGLVPKSGFHFYGQSDPT